MINLYTQEKYGVDHVARTCDCGNYEWKRAGVDPQGCKHVKAIRGYVNKNG